APLAWSRWPWVSRTFSSVTPSWAMAALIRSRSPPGSMTAPRLVRVHHTREQFCWKGVTGRMAALIGVWDIAISDTGLERHGPRGTDPHPPSNSGEQFQNRGSIEFVTMLGRVYGRIASPRCNNRPRNQGKPGKIGDFPGKATPMVLGWL